MIIIIFFYKLTCEPKTINKTWKIMAELKTKLNDGSVVDFINSVSDTKKREDSFVIIDLMKKITKAEPQMWGDSIVGFGSRRFRYASGRELDWFLTGFSPRKQNLTFYIMSGFSEYETLLKKLGKFKTSKSCLYIKNTDDIDLKVLKEIITLSIKYVASKC